jgi:hypothetical protein
VSFCPAVLLDLVDTLQTNSYLQSLIRSSKSAISIIAVSAVESCDSKLNVTFSIFSS